MALPRFLPLYNKEYLSSCAQNYLPHLWDLTRISSNIHISSNIPFLVMYVKTMEASSAAHLTSFWSFTESSVTSIFLLTFSSRQSRLFSIMPLKTLLVSSYYPIPKPAYIFRYFYKQKRETRLHFIHFSWKSPQLNIQIHLLQVLLLTPILEHSSAPFSAIL